MSQVRYVALELLKPADREFVQKNWQRTQAEDPWTRPTHWAFPIDARGDYLRRAKYLEPAYNLDGSRRDQFFSPGGAPSDC